MGGRRARSKVGRCKVEEKSVDCDADVEVSTICGQRCGGVEERDRRRCKGEGGTW